MATEIAKREQSFSAFMDSKSVKDSISNTLRDKASVFTASLIELVSNDKSLQQCSKADLLKEALRAGALGLPLSKSLGLAYIVVYNNNVRTTTPEGREVWQKVPTPTFILGYRGYIQLAMRSGQIRALNADAVYEGEHVELNRLSGEITITGSKTSDVPTGYFAYFQLTTGFSKTLYMTVEDMARYALKFSKGLPKSATVESLIDASATPATGKVGWMGDFNAMARKTVLRRLLGTYCPLSVEMQEALAADTAAETAFTDDRIPTATELKTVKADPAEYVDPDTGEIFTDASAEQAAQPAEAAQQFEDEDPGY